MRRTACAGRSGLGALLALVLLAGCAAPPRPATVAAAPTIGQQRQWWVEHNRAERRKAQREARLVEAIARNNLLQAQALEWQQRRAAKLEPRTERSAVAKAPPVYLPGLLPPPTPPPAVETYQVAPDAPPGNFETYEPPDPPQSTAFAPPPQPVYVEPYQRSTGYEQSGGWGGYSGYAPSDYGSYRSSRRSSRRPPDGAPYDVHVSGHFRQGKWIDSHWRRSPRRH